jgi:hypothetical protein
MDWRLRGRRAVRKGGGLNRGGSCADMWVFPQVLILLNFSACPTAKYYEIFQ